MPTIFEDNDLIEIYREGLKRAIDVIKPSPVIILHINGKAFMEGLNNAAIAANGLAHTQHNTKWLAVRDGLEQLRQNFITLIASGRTPPRARLAATLEGVLAGGLKMATNRAAKRQDVLNDLERRKVANANSRGLSTNADKG